MVYDFYNFYDCLKAKKLYLNIAWITNKIRTVLHYLVFKIKFTESIK